MTEVPAPDPIQPIALAAQVLIRGGGDPPPCACVLVGQPHWVKPLVRSPRTPDCIKKYTSPEGAGAACERSAARSGTAAV